MINLLKDRIKQAHTRHDAKVQLTIDEAERIVTELLNATTRTMGTAEFRATRHDEQNTDSQR